MNKEDLPAEFMNEECIDMLLLLFRHHSALEPMKYDRRSLLWICCHAVYLENNNT